MIDTNTIRVKTVDVAVAGKLTADYISKSSSDKDLNNIGITPGNIADDEVPYELKDGWKWVRMVDLGADAKNSFADGPFGSNLKREHYTTDKQVRIIQLSNVGELGWKDDNEKYTTYEHLETIKRSEVEVGNIVIAKMMPAGRAIIVPDVSKAYVLSSDCVKFVPNAGLNVKYLCYAINSQMFKKQVLQDVHGIGRERTSLSKLKSYLLPIPPVDEQAVIVQKIDSIYELLERIDDLQAKYSNDLAVLKNKIIDAGIQGKLTEQLPEDGTAEELYEQIQEEKAKLIKEGKIKKEKPLPDIAEEEIPFDIPKTWKWVRINEIGSWSAGATPSRSNPAYYVNGDIPWIKTGELNDGFIDDSEEKITELAYKECSVRLNPEGSVLIAMYGATIGKVAILNVEATTNQACCACIPICIDNKYLFYFLKGNKSTFLDASHGGAQPNISKDIITKSLMPLPPLSEQKRISNTIEKILSIIS